ncbi:MAG: hypothetical protein GY771_11340 [bacterium]|nr:hypothetical protein [bacterium]
MDLKSLLTKKVVITAAVVVGGLFVLFAVYYFTVPAFLFDADKAAEKAGETLYNGLGLQLSYEKAKFTAFPRPSVILEKPVLKSKMGKLVFNAEKIKLGNSYLSYLLLSSKLATVDMYEGNLNLKTSDIKQVDIENAEKLKAAVYLHDCNALIYYGERAVTLDGVSGRLKIRSDWGTKHETYGKLNAERMYLSDSADYAGPAVKLAAEGKLTYLVTGEDGNGSVELDDVNLLLGDAKLNIAGTIQTGGDEKEVDLALRGSDMALSQVVPALLPNLAEMNFDGALDLDIAITGDWGNGKHPSIDGSMTIKDGSVEIEDADGISSMQGKIVFKDKRVDIQDISGITVEGNFNVKGSIELSEGTPFELFLSGVYPMELVAAIIGVNPDYKVGGLARLDMDIAGDTVDPLATSLDGSAELLGNRVRLKPFILPFNDLRGTVYFDGFKAKVGKMDGKLVGSRFQVGGELRGYKNPDITFTAVSDDIDFDAALPRDKKHLDKLRKRGDVPLGLDKNGLRIKGGLRFKKCEVLGISGKDMKADFEFADNDITFKTLSIKAYGGEVKATGNVKLSKPASYAFAGKVEDVRIGTFLSENDYLKDGLTGELSGDFTFAARSLDKDTFNKSFTGRGMLKHSGGRATNIEVLEKCAEWSHIGYFDPLQISELETLVVANDGFLSTEKMYLKNRDMEVDVAGRVSLYEDVDLKVSVLFNEEATKAINGDLDALTLISGEDGRGRLDFKVAGTLDVPSFELDTDNTFFSDIKDDGEKPLDVDVDPEDLDIFR